MACTSKNPLDLFWSRHKNVYDNYDMVLRYIVHVHSTHSPNNRISGAFTNMKLSSAGTWWQKRGNLNPLPEMHVKYVI